MPRPLRLLAPAVAACGVAAFAVPSLTGAQEPGARDITVREKVRAVQLVDTGPRSKRDRVSLGDRLITRQALFDTGDKRIGTLSTDCVSVGQTAQFFQATLQCTTTYALRDGIVTAVGIVRLSDPATQLPIAAGTGAYADASGHVGAGEPVEGYDSVSVIRLKG